MPRKPLQRPIIRSDQRVARAMARARDAIFALAEIMPHHNGPNADFSRFMVNLKAELIRAGYIAAGDGKGGFLASALPTAAELAERREARHARGQAQIRAIDPGEAEAGEAANEERRELAVYVNKSRCGVCLIPIASGELCDEHAKDNDPFATAENSGKDLRR